MGLEFPQLPYEYDALEPHIDKQTMEIHYSRHHRAYFDKFVAAVKGTRLETQPLEDIFAGVSQAPAAVRNNGGGFFNHVLYWNSMSPNGGGEPKGALGKSLEKTFGSADEFRKKFSDAGLDRFGSGWAWLLVRDGSLMVASTPNQDNPLMDVCEVRGAPILCMDVWEHAYYLKYQNRRPDYIKAWWNTVDWRGVEAGYEKAMEALKVAR
ncbi:MAG TPA: superoxide dismutase [Elusimicrobia bacterium]|nr:superoxide dismutase [Elusimicrobiota bacterium]